MLHLFLHRRIPMNLLKDSRLFGFVAVLAAGLFFVLQPDLDKDTTKNALPPKTIAPGYQGSGPLSIVPDDRDTTKIEYRNILFSRDKIDKAFGSAEGSSVASPEFLYIKSTKPAERRTPGVPAFAAGGFGAGL
jgi:hypothetical protein